MISTKHKIFEISSAALHIIAMACMLLDHAWATVMPYNWMTCAGRVAFPIFAFMTVEGFTHTKNFKKYMLRMFAFAIVSEIPFNLMYGGEVFYPFHQNVLWTFLIALSGLWLMEEVKKRNKIWLTIIVDIAVCFVGTVLGYVCFVDYYGCGILTVFVFYFFNRANENSIIVQVFKKSSHKQLIWSLICFAGQFASLYFINVKILGGLYYDVTIFNKNFEIVQQGLALIALIPIWLYSGKKGYSAKWFKYFNYAFYPAHCLVLSLLSMYVR